MEGPEVSRPERAGADMKKTGGGGPVKESPYRDLIFQIIGNTSEVVSGTEGKK